jgi:hypothetical protein
LNDGSVWPYYVEEQPLRVKGKWDPVVADALVACLDAKRAVNRAVIGYRDFTNGGEHCDGQ